MFAQPSFLAPIPPDWCGVASDVERKASSLLSKEEFNKIYSGLFFARFLSLDMLLVTTPLLGVMHSPITVSSVCVILPPSLCFWSALVLFFFLATVTGLLLFENGSVNMGVCSMVLLQNDPSMSSSAQSLGSPRGCIRISRILVTGISSKDTEAVFVLMPEDVLSSTNPDFPLGLPPLADSSLRNLAAISSQEYGNPSWKRSQICSKRQSCFELENQQMILNATRA